MAGLRLFCVAVFLRGLSGLGLSGLGLSGLGLSLGGLGLLLFLDLLCLSGSGLGGSLSLELFLGDLGDFGGVLDDFKGFLGLYVLGDVVLAENLADGVLLHAVLLSKVFILGVKVFLGDLDVLELCNFLKGETALDLALRTAAEAVAEVLLRHAGVAEIGLEVKALGLDLIAELTDGVVDLMLKHGLRDLTLDDAGEFLEDLGVDLGVSGLGLGLLEVLFRVLLELSP